MTDRYDGFTVVLDRAMRSDDAEHITNAIKMIRGVADVRPIISTTEGWAAAHSARLTLLKSLQDWLRDEYRK